MGDEKYVYSFGGGSAEGNESMKNLLGGKGANLAEMAGHPALRLPVPPGFTVTTEVCTWYYTHQHTFPYALQDQVHGALRQIEALMGKSYGDPENPLLLSVRSGARRSMPGMMDTVLNLGLNDATVTGLIRSSGDARFAYDAYRRLVMMYADVVMEKASGKDAIQEKGIRRKMEETMHQLKVEKGAVLDTELTADDLCWLVGEYKRMVKDLLGIPFPEDVLDQLWGGIGAVFASWNGKRAIEYRRIEHIPDDWGTAVNVQAMVFGNMGHQSATGVAFTRNPGNGKNYFYGEYLVNAQGEDVVAGIRTPAPINAESKNAQSEHLETLSVRMPALYEELDTYQKKLERHYRDMQDIEFTIEKGTLYMLQCRTGKRNGMAAVTMAVDMYREGLITKETAIRRVTPAQLVELLLPRIDPDAEKAIIPLAKGLPAGPGGAKGKIVFDSDTAVSWAADHSPVILVRDETSPEDVDGMHAARAILTSKGGMTSHAALVARGWGKCCIVGCQHVDIDTENKTLTTESGLILREGDWISLNGTTGNVYAGELPLISVDVDENVAYKEFINLTDDVKKLDIRANADTPEDAAQALRFGAKGIGLFRTEHMFYGENSDEPLLLLRKVIISDTPEERKNALDQLFVFVKEDIYKTLRIMGSLPVTIRLLDPPLHEFVPHDRQKLTELSREIGIKVSVLKKRVLALHENNPMLGHRGVRLGISYPDITEMQVRAIFEAAAELKQQGISTFPEIMVPVVCTVEELRHQKALVQKIYAEVCQSLQAESIPYAFGSMIETPRAALTADQLAQEAEFFSFGTNDLTQMTFGFSRDDIGGFLPNYLDQKILPNDPFQTLDPSGVGELVRMGIQRGRSSRAYLEVGICGEHGGDPESVAFCHRLGMNYVSCSPFRVPVARLAAAQAALDDK